MYQAFDAPAVHQLLGTRPEDAPRGLILHGIYDMANAARHWRDRLAKARVAENAFNIVIGEHHDKTIWYAPVLGAPLAAFAAHCAAILGARSIVQIGSYGGTRRGATVGDLLVVTGAGRGDGASDWYLPFGAPALPDVALTERLRQSLRRRGLTWHEGPVFTTPAFMAEKWEDIVRWEREGYAGVEMEAATTLAVAQHFGIPSACLAYLLDNLIEEHGILDVTEEQRQAIRARRSLLGEVALEVVVEG
jgi:uridine phosphorylase